MNLRSIQKFHLKGQLIILLVITSLFILMVLSLNTSVYARIPFGDDCRPCHQSGILVLSNATETIQVEIDESLWLEVSASGGVPRNTELIWSNVSHNSYFSFVPNYVKDNGPRDTNSEGGEITALFEITAPSTEGNYIIRSYAASSQGRGGYVEIEVVVGAGGEIPQEPLTVIMELVAVVVPLTFGGGAILGIALYTVKWNKISEEES